jgi:sulfide dehydrogenase [flavocytochrome c] flavoprotein subunit
MSAITRRQFLRASGTGIGLGLLGGSGRLDAPLPCGDIAPKTGPRVVVVGGGWSGATAARYVRLADPGSR